MRKYNIKRDIAYYQGKVNAYDEILNVLREEFVLSDCRDVKIGRILSTAEISRGTASSILKSLEEKRDDDSLS